jgi:acyl phosphate:glycerol-3-phosphate acyltransferase
MQPVIALGVLALSYVIGSIPFGLVIVRLATGKDIRKIESGRTGGTNAMRAAGFWAGLATALLDLGKATFAVALARVALNPDLPWVEVAAPLLAVLGHNYSIFLAERTAEGRLRLKGGAGGAPTAGGMIGLWWPSVLFVVPVGALILYFIGYASLATLSAGLTAIVIFAVRAAMGLSPWEYVLYGVAAEILLIIALRPNIRRLMNGTERLVGLRARLRRRQQQTQ